MNFPKPIFVQSHVKMTKRSSLVINRPPLESDTKRLQLLEFVYFKLSLYRSVIHMGFTVWKNLWLSQSVTGLTMIHKNVDIKDSRKATTTVQKEILIIENIIQKLHHKRKVIYSRFMRWKNLWASEKIANFESLLQSKVKIAIEIFDDAIPYSRCEEELDCLKDLILTLSRIQPIFSKLNPSQLQRLCEELHFQQITQKTLVFSQGTVGNAVYIVVYGKCDLFFEESPERESHLLLYKPDTQDEKFQKGLLNIGKYMKTLTMGSIFGDLSAISQKLTTRSCTVIAKTGGLLLRIPIATYRTTLQEYRENEINVCNAAVMMSESMLFSHCLTSMILNTAYRMKYKQVPAKTILIQANDPTKSVYLIYSGEIKAFRMEDYNNNNNNSYDNINTSSTHDNSDETTPSAAGRRGSVFGGGGVGGGNGATAGRRGSVMDPTSSSRTGRRNSVMDNITSMPTKRSSIVSHVNSTSTSHRPITIDYCSATATAITTSSHYSDGHTSIARSPSMESLGSVHKTMMINSNTSTSTTTEKIGSRDYTPFNNNTRSSHSHSTSTGNNGDNNNMSSTSDSCKLNSSDTTNYTRRGSVMRMAKTAVSLYGKGVIIGEKELFNSQRTFQMTYITSTSCEIFEMDARVFLELTSPEQRDESKFKTEQAQIAKDLVEKERANVKRRVKAVLGPIACQSLDDNLSNDGYGFKVDPLVSNVMKFKSKTETTSMTTSGTGTGSGSQSMNSPQKNSSVVYSHTYKDTIVVGNLLFDPPESKDTDNHLNYFDFNSNILPNSKKRILMGSGSLFHPHPHPHTSHSPHRSLHDNGIVSEPVSSRYSSTPTSIAPMLNTNTSTPTSILGPIQANSSQAVLFTPLLSYGSSSVGMNGHGTDYINGTSNSSNGNGNGGELHQFPRSVSIRIEEKRGNYATSCSNNNNKPLTPYHPLVSSVKSPTPLYSAPSSPITTTVDNNSNRTTLPSQLPSSSMTFLRRPMTQGSLSMSMSMPTMSMFSTRVSPVSSTTTTTPHPLLIQQKPTTSEKIINSTTASNSTSTTTSSSSTSLPSVGSFISCKQPPSSALSSSASSSFLVSVTASVKTSQNTRSKVEEVYYPKKTPKPKRHAVSTPALPRRRFFSPSCA
eukprot:gene1347-2597_t